jgi:hypothetical protein
MGFDIELTTLKETNTEKIEDAFGKDLALVIGKIKNYIFQDIFWINKELTVLCKMNMTL